MPKATTIRLTDEVFARLDQASARTGMPVNSIVIAACLEWMQRHTPPPIVAGTAFPGLAALAPAPRWATIRRAVELATSKRPAPGLYPFDAFTTTAQNLLTAAQAEARKTGFTYIGTEHLMLAAFVDSTSQAAMILSALGIRELFVRTTLEKGMRGKKPPEDPRIVPTSRVKKVVELAFKLCGAAGDPLVSTGHILLALASEGQGIAANVLKDAGITPDRIATAMEELTGPEA